MKLFRKVLLIHSLWISSVAPSDPLPPSHAEGLWWGTHAGANVIALITAPGGNSSNRFALLGGVRTDYMFGEYVGIFVGSDLTTRGSKLVSGDVATASFIDIPLGFSWRHGHILFSDEVREFFHFGGYVAFPQGDLKTDSTPVQESMTSFGAYLDIETHFPVAEHIGLGYKIWGKVGLSDSFKPSLSELQKIIELGIGLSFRFH